MRLKSRIKEWVIVAIMLAAYTAFVVYVCTLPQSSRIIGWTVPDNGIVIKTDDGYVAIGNGQILDFGSGMKVRVIFKKVEGEVAQ